MNGSVEVAQRYLAASLCVLPIMADGSKRPLGDWEQWQHKLPAPQEVAAWFAHCDGYGVVCGRISGGLETLDFDDGALFAPWCTLVEVMAPGLVARLPRDETPRLGHHVYWRCAEIAGNMKLARAQDGKKALIETRGEGGFIVVPPTAARYHEKQKPYRMLRGDLAAIPEITPQERAILLEAATTFNQYTPRIVEAPKEPGANAGNRPGDKWAAAHTWADILEPHGWRALSQRGQTIYWQRPGKDGPGNSATTGHNGHDILYVFSSNAAPFESEAGYSKFTAYAFLNHGGNFTAATKEVVALGYGDPPEARPLPEEPSWMGEAPDDIALMTPRDTPRPPGKTRNIEALRADAGNAARLARLFGARLRFVPTWGWLAWDGKRWNREQGESESRNAARRVALSFYADADAAANIADDFNAKALAAWAHSSLARPRLEAMIALGESEAALWARPSEFDLDPWLFNCWNGTLDLQTGELKAHDPNDMITQISPVSYVPGAQSEVWDDFLKTATQGNAEHGAYLRRAAGYSLTGHTWEEVFWLLLGPEATGKTTFSEALRAILGTYAVKASFETFLEQRTGGARSDIASLAGARLVTAVEANATKRMAESLIKELMGGDTISARHLYHEPFSFKPQCKLILAANASPKISDEDGAIWRRLRRLPFEHTIPENERNPEVKAFLTDPQRGGPAVLAWAVKGCKEWQKERLGYPACIREKTKELREEMDPLKDFFTERCALGVEKWISTGALRAAYEKWAGDRGEKPTIQGREWGKRLRAKGAEPKTKRAKAEGQTERGWQGIDLQSVTDSENVTDVTP